MVKEIELAEKIKLEKEVCFNQASVNSVEISDKELNGMVILRSTEHDNITTKFVPVNIAEKTVEQVIVELEIFTKEKIDLSKLTVIDFIHSIVHENIGE